MSKDTQAAQRWVKIIDRQEVSGQSIRAFSNANGLNHGSMSYWRSRLGRTKKHKAKASTFVEVTLTEAVEPSVVVAFDNHPAHVVVDDDTDLQRLRRVVAALC